MPLSIPMGPVMFDLDGQTLSAEEETLLQNPLIGGVIYFARNYASPDQISELTQSIREIRPDLLIAVDQEGGRVQRFKAGFTRIPAMQQFLQAYRSSAHDTLELVKDSAWLMASELLAVGLDFSFAPVLDRDDCRCAVIADRSFSPKVEELIALASAWIDGMQEAGMAATGKHFPGHGQVVEDSHLTTPVDRRCLEEIKKQDMLPFKVLAPKLNAIMPAHIVFPEVDSKHTVGFSSYWLQSILRQDLQFDGVIFSDDLTMAGAASAGSFVTRARLALEAGCTMVLVCNHRQGLNEILNQLDYPMPIKSQQQLQSMRAFSTLTLNTLQETSRWKYTHEWLNSLSAA